MAIDADRIQKPTRTLRKFLKKNPKQPTLDQIRDLRTNTRRLEATSKRFHSIADAKAAPAKRPVSHTQTRWKGA
jgi:hypothetical protein